MWSTTSRLGVATPAAGTGVKTSSRRAAKRTLLVAQAASNEPRSAITARTEIYSRRTGTKTEHRGSDSTVATAVATEVAVDTATQTESAVRESSEDVDVIQEATTEMGVEDLFTYEAEVEVLDSNEEEPERYSEDMLNLQQALDCTANRGHSVLPDDFSTPKSSTTTQISDLCLAFPLSNVQMPTYSGTELDVGIAHFGVGGFFRAHQLAYMDYLLRHNLEQNKRWGYMGIGMLPQDKAMRDALREQENMYTVVAHSASASSAEIGLDPESNISENLRVVAALKDMLLAPDEPGQVLRTLASEGTKIFSLTITEFGYTVPTSRADTELAQVAKDAAKEPWDAMDADAQRYAGATAIGMIVAGLQARRAFGTGGATILSCDNIPGNGDYVKDKVLERAEAIGGGLKEWILFNCTFPNCMVDRITPMTTDAVKRSLSDKHGIKDNWPVACETFSQWVIEDNFVEGLSGRPRWESVGVQLVKDVKPYELAKIRMLNVTHSVLAFPALLMGLENVHDAATNPLVKDYFNYVMREELRPTLLGIEGIGNINLEKYQDILVERFSNTLVADTLMRISHDTSNKFSIQGCPAVREGLALGLSMKGMAFMVACWAHFILKCRRAGIEFKDGHSAALEAAMAGNDILALLDMEPIFHDLMFEDGWRTLAVDYFEAIHTEGIRQVLRDFNAAANPKI